MKQVDVDWGFKLIGFRAVRSRRQYRLQSLLSELSKLGSQTLIP